MIDLKNKRFGSWLVVERNGSDKHREAVWRAKCDCGAVKLFRSRALRSGQGLVCKKCKSNTDDRLIFIENSIGLKFGRWTIVGDFEPRYSKRSKRWYKRLLCECDCGTIKGVDERSLFKGLTTSCGCKRVEAIQSNSVFDDLSGRRFGKWLVNKRVADTFYPKGGRQQTYECVCECGTVRCLTRPILLSEQSFSCGCVKNYRLERIVQEWLIGNGFNYKSEYSFDDLVSDKNVKLRYDFKIDNVLIECQGEQHYKPFDYFGGVSKFNRLRQHDSLKRIYAEANAFKLIYIPYWLSDVEIYDLLTQNLL